MAPIIQLSPEMSAAQEILSGGNPLAGLVPESNTPDYAGPVPVSGGPTSAPAPTLPAGQSALAEEPKIGVSEGFGQQMARIADQIATKNPQQVQQPGGWARQLVGAAQTALAGFGDVSTKPGGGALAGIAETMANRNARVTAQKQQDFNNQRQLNTEQREKDLNDARVAHANLENYQTQVLIHNALEDQEAKEHNIDNGKKDYLTFTSGDVPATDVKKGISGDEANKLLQDGKLNGHEYMAFPVDKREVGKDPNTKQPLFETLFNVTEVPPKFTWTKEAAAEVNKFAPTGQEIIPGTVTKGSEAYFLTQRARTNEASQAALDQFRHKNELDEIDYENKKDLHDQYTRVNALQPEFGAALAKANGDVVKATQAILRAHPDQQQAVMGVLGNGNAAEGLKAYETAYDKQQQRAMEWAKTKQAQGEELSKNFVFTNKQLAQIAALPPDRKAALEQYPKDQQATILQLGTNAGDLSFKEVALRQAKGLNAMPAQQLSAAVTSIFPQWNEQRHDILLKARRDVTTGPTRDAIDHYNAFLGHAAKLQDVITELGRKYPPLYNTALNAIHTQMGAEDVAKLRAAISPAQNEWTEFMKDGKAASIAEQAKIRELFPDNANIGQMVAAIKQGATTGVIRLAPHDTDYRKAEGPDSQGLPGLLTEPGAHALVHINPDDQTKREAGKFNVGGTLWDDANSKRTTFEDVQKADVEGYAKQQAEKLHTQPQSLAIQNAPPGAPPDTQWRVSQDGKSFIYLINNQWVNSQGKPVQ